ncbi:energy transducer TonB [Candidatus Nitrospira salsa]
MILFSPFLIGIPGGLAQAPEQDEVETLDIIEIPGTAVTKKPRNLAFPEPDTTSLHPVFDDSLLHIPVSLTIDHPIPQPSPALDPIGHLQGVRSPVKPIKAEHPPYPRFAREQGWEGITVVRITVETDGRVVSATTQKSSGFPVLDESAVQTVTQWVFTPAKNGEFNVASTVDLPIRFDLDQPN